MKLGYGINTRLSAGEAQPASAEGAAGASGDEQMSSEGGVHSAAPFRRWVIGAFGHPELLQRALNTAEKELIEQAMRHRNQGILVTRLDNSAFLAELTPDVPYGTTWEQDLF